MSKRQAFILLAVLIVAIICLKVFPPAFGIISKDIPTTEVKRGEFVVNLTETGELKAFKSVSITAPRIYESKLKITYLAPEGSCVKEGDVLVQFDPTDLQKKVVDYELVLKMKQSDLSKAISEQRLSMRNLKSEVENAKIALDLAKLDVEKKKFAAKVERETAELNLKKAELALKDAEKKLVLQGKGIESGIEKLRLEVEKQEKALERAQKELQDMTIKAEIPGLVVYKKTYSGGSLEKIKVGDSPWYGYALIELPDLSQMIVETQVNEVDVSKVKVGQKVVVKLDAVPDLFLHGKVTKVASLGREKERGSKIKVFDVTASIDESDERLRPGMTAMVEIVAHRIEDALYIPQMCVFDKGGESVVYVKRGRQIKKRIVELGERNENDVCVLKGLDEGEKICLYDPTKKRGKPGAEKRAAKTASGKESITK